MFVGFCNSNTFFHFKRQPSREFVTHIVAQQQKIMQKRTITMPMSGLNGIGYKQTTKYNHSGERIVKSHGSMEGVYINGAPQGITLSGVDFRLRLCKSSKLVCSRLALKFHETDEYTLYPDSIISVNKISNLKG